MFSLHSGSGDRSFGPFYDPTEFKEEVAVQPKPTECEVCGEPLHYRKERPNGKGVCRSRYCRKEYRRRDEHDNFADAFLEYASRDE